MGINILPVAGQVAYGGAIMRGAVGGSVYQGVVELLDMVKNKIFAYIIAFVVCQTIAVLIWFIFKKNYFVIMAVVSIVVIATAYKVKK